MAIKGQLLERVAAIVAPVASELTFRMLEIGALQLPGLRGPFYRLLELFPGSQVVSVEVDPAECEAMNQTAPAGVRYYPAVLGAKRETRSFYETVHPMCNSLYPPNQAFMSLHNNLEVAKLKNTTTVETVSLDEFIESYEIGPVDFIKIDVQGAELEVFQGGVQTLRNALAIVSEVEFVPMYPGQPLFGDVCAFLGQHDLMFHKFLGLAGRALKPIVLHQNPNAASQHMWSDAVFVRQLLSVPALPPDQLLKLSVLGCLYGSPDLSHFCLEHYDLRHGTDLAQQFLHPVR